MQKKIRSKEKKTVSFRSFLKNKDQRADWLLLLLTCTVAYIALRICYPYPAAMADSATYVGAASQDAFTFYRPFGYSFFLQIVHAITANIHAVFIVQMVFYFAATSVFAFTVKYFFKPVNKYIWYALLLFFVFSPPSFYLANMLLSDLLFANMVYFMLAAFIFVIKKQSNIGLVCFLAAFFCALHIRYSAMIFPVVFIILFFTIKGKMRWISIGLTLFTAFIFYQQIQSNMKETVGIRQFSTGFDGWQLANNGMHVVPFIDLNPDEIKDPHLRNLHYLTGMYKEAILQATNNGTEPTFVFMWDNDKPLKQYLFYYIEQSKAPYPVAWVQLGSGPYKDYGSFLIRKYPGKFLKHYYLPNSKQIFYPSKTGIMKNYSSMRSMENICQWYNLPAQKDVKATYPLYGDIVSKMVAPCYLILWIAMIVLGISAFICRKKLRWEENEKKAFWGIVVFGIFFYASTAFAGPIEFRFWLPMGAVLFFIIYILSNKLLGVWKSSAG